MASVDDESVEVLLDLAHVERQIRMDSLDSLDAKAGVLVGFAGVLVSLTVVLPHWWMRLAAMTPALISAGLAFAALCVKKVDGFKLKEARDGYIARAAPITRQTVLDTSIEIQGRIEQHLSTKSERVTQALYSLAIGIAVMAALVLIFGGSNV